MDPVELRLRNYSGEDQQGGKPYTMPDGLRACYERVTAAFGWHDWQRPPETGAKRRGIGFAAHNWIGGAGHPPGYAWVKMNGDGSVDVVTGTQDIGTGTRTGLTQVAAEELGLPMDRVNLQLGDTAIIVGSVEVEHANAGCGTRCDPNERQRPAPPQFSDGVGIRRGVKKAARTPAGRLVRADWKNCPAAPAE